MRYVRTLKIRMDGFASSTEYNLVETKRGKCMITAADARKFTEATHNTSHDSRLQEVLQEIERSSKYGGIAITTGNLWTSVIDELMRLGFNVATSEERGATLYHISWM